MATVGALTVEQTENYLLQPLEQAGIDLKTATVP